jgi:hypothetical protein
MQKIGCDLSAMATHCMKVTQSINTLSLAPNACTGLANTRYPRILHVFDRACNLINERREVLSIVTPQIGNGPFNLTPASRLRKVACQDDPMPARKPITGWEYNQT